MYAMDPSYPQAKDATCQIAEKYGMLLVTAMPQMKKESHAKVLARVSGWPFCVSKRWDGVAEMCGWW